MSIKFGRYKFSQGIRSIVTFLLRFLAASVGAKIVTIFPLPLSPNALTARTCPLASPIVSKAPIMGLDPVRDRMEEVVSGDLYF